MNSSTGQHEQLLVVQETDEGMTTVRLNRPHIRNAFKLALRRELAAAFASLSETQPCAALHCIDRR